MRTFIISTAILLTGCVKEVSVPVVLDKPVVPTPAECVASHPPRLKPLPRGKAGDRIEDVMAAVGRVHRANAAQYVKVMADRSVCGAFVRGTNRGDDKGS